MSSPSDFVRFVRSVSAAVHLSVLNASDSHKATQAEQAVQRILEMLCITTHGAHVDLELLTAAFAGILRCDSAANSAAASFIHAVRSAPKRARSERTVPEAPSSHKKAKTAKKVEELTAEAEALMCPISRGPIVDAVSVNGHSATHIFDRTSIESHLETHGGSAAHPIERNVRITRDSISTYFGHASLVEAFFKRVANKATKHPEAYADLQAMAVAWTEERKKLADNRTRSTVVTPTAGTIHAGPEPMSYDSHTTHQGAYSYSPTSPNYWPVPGYEPPSPAHSPTDPDQVADHTTSADEPHTSRVVAEVVDTPPPLANGANVANGPDLYANIPLIEIQDSDDEAGEGGGAPGEGGGAPDEEDRRNQGQEDRMDEDQAPTKSSHIIGCFVSWGYDDTKQLIGWVIARRVTGQRTTLIIRTPSGSTIEADSSVVCPAPIKLNDTVTILGPDIDGSRSYIGRSGVVSDFLGDSRSNAIVTMADTTANRIFAQAACAPMRTVD
jgi:hypothetical protein